MTSAFTESLEEEDLVKCTDAGKRTLVKCKSSLSSSFISLSISCYNFNHENEPQFPDHRYAMKCLDKKRIKMKQGETLALNERLMLSLVSTGVSCLLLFVFFLFIFFKEKHLLSVNSKLKEHYSGAERKLFECFTELTGYSSRC